MKEEIIIFTDGSCYAKDPCKRGGFGVYIQYKGKEYSYRKGYTHTTISRMELRAIHKALTLIKTDKPVSVFIYSDSQYAVNMIQSKIFEWQNNLLENHFENSDLLNLIFTEVKNHPLMRLKLRWIRGHGKDYEDPITRGNFIADYLADYKTQKDYERDAPKESNSYEILREELEGLTLDDIS